MNKQRTAETARDASSPVIRGEAERSVIGALVCDAVLLGILLWDQIFYGMNMWFAIIPLLVIFLYLAYICFFPEEYCFTETSLEVRRLFCKTACIAYDGVFGLETKSRDRFVNLMQDNKVKVYYTSGSKKKMVICRPRDVYAFAEEMKKRCPELSEEEKPITGLDVFWKE